MQAFHDRLATTGVERGLIGPREVPRLWSRHLANCAVVAQEALVQIPEGASVVDIGSGAGLPGVAWALVRKDIQVTLLEPLLRRATFLLEVVSELGLEDRVEVVRGRAEDHQRRYDTVTSRAVAPLPVLANWSLPLCRDFGWVVALKGNKADGEVAAAKHQIEVLGGEGLQVVRYGITVLPEPTTVVQFKRGRSN